MSRDNSPQYKMLTIKKRPGETMEQTWERYQREQAAKPRGPYTGNMARGDQFGGRPRGPMGIMPGEVGVGYPGMGGGFPGGFQGGLPGGGFPGGGFPPRPQRPNPLGMIYTQPFAPFNNFWSESELEDVADAAGRAFEMSIHGFEMYHDQMRRTMGQLNQHQKKMVESLPAIRNDLLNYQSVVKEQSRLNLDQNLKNQASRIATLSGGPAAMMVAQMNKEANKMAMETANGSQIQRLKEHQKQKQMYYDVVNDRLGHIGQTQTTMANLINQWGANDVNMAQSGLQAQLNTVRNLVALRNNHARYELDRDKLQVGWNASVLNSNTSVYGAQLQFASQRFSSMTAAMAQMYSSHNTARAYVYGADTESKTKLEQAILAANAGLRESFSNNTSAERIAAMRIGASRYQTEASMQMGAWQLEAMLEASLAGQEYTLSDSMSKDGAIGRIRAGLGDRANNEHLLQSIIQAAMARNQVSSGQDVAKIRRGAEDTKREIEGVE